MQAREPVVAPALEVGEDQRHAGHRARGAGQGGAPALGREHGVGAEAERERDRGGAREAGGEPGGERPAAGWRERAAVNAPSEASRKRPSE